MEISSYGLEAEFHRELVILQRFDFEQGAGNIQIFVLCRRMGVGIGKKELLRSPRMEKDVRNRQGHDVYTVRRESGIRHEVDSSPRL